MSSLPPEIEPRRIRAKAWFEDLQTRICATLETLEAEASDALYPGDPGRFDMRPWTRETGTGGGTGGHLRGRLFEKVGVHTSSAIAKFSPEMAATMPGADKDPSYVSASISLIVHPMSPRVPTFPLTGDDVIKAGTAKGPLVGQVLREVEDWWIDHDFLDDPMSAIEKLKAVVQGLAY